MSYMVESIFFLIRKEKRVEWRIICKEIWCFLFDLVGELIEKGFVFVELIFGVKVIFLVLFFL